MPATRQPPPEGHYVQVYRGAIRGADHKQRLAALDTALAWMAEAGVVGVAFHGFTLEMTPKVFAECADLAAHHRLVALAAFGLDATDPAGKGARMAAVGKLPQCAGVLVDAEGAYDSGAQGAAVAMGKAFRADAPDAWVATQPWPLPGYHAHFPYEEFAAWTDAVMPQFYVQDWKRQHGDAAYEKMWPAFEAAWQKLERERLAPRGLVRPRFPTIQGRAWPLGDLVDCLARHPFAMIWCEPFPDAVTMQAIRMARDARCVAPPPAAA